jgi:hypothetical protein
VAPPLFERPIAQKVMKLKKFGKISYSIIKYLSFKVVFMRFSKKSSFVQVIHNNLGQTQNLGARI